MSPALRCVQEIVGEVLEAELGGLDQVADEGQRVLEDALERRAGLLDVDERAGAHHLEDDLQQVPDRLAGPGEELHGKAPKTPAILTKAFGGRMRSMISSDLSAFMNSAGICRTKPISPASAPWNQAQARGMALAFLMFSQTSSWPINFMKPPISASGRARHGLAGDRVLAEHRLQQVVAARAFGQLRQRQQDRLANELEDVARQGLAKRRSGGRWAR